MIWNPRPDSDAVGRLAFGPRLLIWAALALALPALKAAPDNALSRYTYEDTKHLVSFVESAAALVEHEGERAFQEFGRSGSEWWNDKYYIFVYSPAGDVVFHPVAPNLVGRNLLDLRDANGKPVTRLIADIARQPEKNASGWIFYLWEYQTQLIPLWKSSYVRKAVAPDGRTYLVGSGLYNMKIEKAWVERRVKMACTLLAKEGKAEAFKAFLDASSPFVFLGTYVFVLDGQAHTVVDPAYPTLSGRDLSEFKDAVGMPVMQELLRKLDGASEAWVQYLWPKPGDPLPRRKLIYARKVRLDGETFIVGSDFFLATPIWMKG
jgi:signal transduction histidine kinase